MNEHELKQFSAWIMDVATAKDKGSKMYDTLTQIGEYIEYIQIKEQRATIQNLLDEIAEANKGNYTIIELIELLNERL